MKPKLLRRMIRYAQARISYRSYTSHLLSKTFLALTAFTIGLFFAPTASKAEQALPTSYTTVFYVSPSGNDSNPGTAAAPFKTIGHAISNPNLTAGCCVCVEDGTYNELLMPTIGGNANSPTGYVTVMAQHTGKAKIVGPAVVPGTPYSPTAVVYISANYFIFSGFEVTGGGNGTHGVTVDQWPRVTGQHHIQVLNCTVHDVGGAGIASAWGDWYNFIGNVVYNTSTTSGYQTSMGMWDNFPVTNYTPTVMDTSSKYHNILSNNILSNNILYNNFYTVNTPGHTDGNGIICDTLGWFTYNARTLVASNLCYSNGGRGIHVFNNNGAAAGNGSTGIAPVDVINNTCFNNMLDQNNNSTAMASLSELVHTFTVF